MNEVLIKANNDNCFLQNMAKDFDISFQVEAIMPSNMVKNGGTALVRFQENEETFNKIIEYISKKENPPFSIIETVSLSNENYLFYARMLRSCGCNAFSETGCFLKRCQFTPNGIYLEIMSGGDGTLSELIKKFSYHGFDIKILKKRNIENQWDLTTRQKDILQNAFDLGYFDVPKKISLKELSKEVGVSPSSIDEILKRAKKKIISHYLMR